MAEWILFLLTAFFAWVSAYSLRESMTTMGDEGIGLALLGVLGCAVTAMFLIGWILALIL